MEFVLVLSQRVSVSSSINNWVPDFFIALFASLKYSCKTFRGVRFSTFLLFANFLTSLSSRVCA